MYKLIKEQDEDVIDNTFVKHSKIHQSFPNVETNEYMDDHNSMDRSHCSVGHDGLIHINHTI